MLKKMLISTVIAAGCFVNMFNFAYAVPQESGEIVQEEVNEPQGLAPHAESALLIDMKSGMVLFEKNADEKRFPASTTKILTSIIALETANLSDVVVAPAAAIEPITREHSNMGILIGEELTVEDLLYGVLVHSANDAANVLAIHVSGSLDAFAENMNQKAQELGAVNSHFVNPHGFHDENHYTTARDLSIIAQYAMQNEKFREIVATASYIIPPTNKYDEDRYLSNTNHLVSRVRNHTYFYKKATGIKTGYTGEAKNCLVSSATDGQTELMSVVMKCESDSFTDSKELLEYGFKNYKYAVISPKGELVGDSCIVYEAKDDIRVSLTTDIDVQRLMPVDYKQEDIVLQRHIDGKIKAPVQKGDILGSVTFVYNGEEVGSANLVAINDVKKDYIKAAINLFVKIITNPVVLIALAIFIFLRIAGAINRRKRRRYRRQRLDHFRY